MQDAKYPDVRALSRGLALLECLSEQGWATPAELNEITGIDRTTIYRLLGTLSKLGYVSRRDEDGSFALTEKVIAVANGVRHDDQTLTIVGESLARLVEHVKWPSDFARLTNGRIVIEGSNHRLSPMTFHRGTIGKERSILKSALGKAILSILTETEFKMLEQLGEASILFDGHNGVAAAKRCRLEIERKGCTIAVGLVDRNVTAIAVPLRCAGVPCAVNMVFFRNVIAPDEAVRRFLPALKQCAAEISEQVG